MTLVGLLPEMAAERYQHTVPEVRESEAAMAGEAAEPGGLDPATLERDSGASFNAASDQSRPSLPGAGKPRWGVWLASAALGGAIASAGWFGASDLFEEDGHQRVANHWMEFRGCLLGARLPHGVRPADQAHFIRLGNVDKPQHADWPARCSPYAASLDEAMQAPNLNGEFADAPSATSLLSGNDLTTHSEALNQLYDVLTAADLPVATGAHKVVNAPEPQKPLFEKSALHAIGRIADLSAVQARTDSTAGESLRLLVPEHPALLCSLNESNTASERWRSIACGPTAKALLNKPGLRMSRFAAGAPTLLTVRDGSDGGAVSFYDATTGQRLWRSRKADAVAATTKDGAAVVLEGAILGPNGKRKHRPKMVRLTPGKRPQRRTLRLKKNASAMLLPDALLWWRPNENEAIAVDLVGAQNLTSGKKRGADLARLPHNSRVVGDCAGAFGNVVLTRNDTQPPRYTLLFHRGGREGITVDAGIIDAKVTMACHDRTVTLLRERGDDVNLSQCSRARCTELGRVRVDNQGLSALGTIGDKLISVTTGTSRAVRLKMGTPTNFDSANSRILLDGADRADLQIVGMRVLSGELLAIVLLQAADGTTYGLRVDSTRVRPLLVEQ